MPIVRAIICPTVRSAGGEVERPRVAGSPGEKVRGRVWELEATGWRPAAQAKSEASKILMARLESVEFLRAGDGGGSIRVGNAGLVWWLFPLGEGGFGVVPQAAAGALDGSLGTRTVTPSSASLAATEFQVVAHGGCSVASRFEKPGGPVRAGRPAGSNATLMRRLQVPGRRGAWQGWPA